MEVTTSEILGCFVGIPFTKVTPEEPFFGGFGQQQTRIRRKL